MAAEHGTSLPTSDKLAARLKLSEQFLDEVLLPRIHNDALTPDEIITLHGRFKKEHAGLGDDFELGHTYQAAWKRDLVNEKIAKTDANKLPLDAPDIVVAMGLLEQVIISQNHSKEKEEEPKQQVVRVILQYSDGTVNYLEGEEAQRSIDTVNSALFIDQIHGGEPPSFNWIATTSDELPQIIARQVDSPKDKTDTK